MYQSFQLTRFDTLWQWFIDVELVGKFASLGSRPVLFMKILVPHTSGQAGHRGHQANQQSTNNEYNHSLFFWFTISRYRHHWIELVCYPGQRLSLLLHYPWPTSFRWIKYIYNVSPSTSWCNLLQESISCPYAITVQESNSRCIVFINWTTVCFLVL